MAAASASQGGSPRKVIIDTDPGIDDALALFMAFQSPSLKVVGLCSTFGNTFTPTATRNCLHLCELAGRGDVPVAEGEHRPLNGKEPIVADFVHGSDGLGNTFPSPPKGKALGQGAVDFMLSQTAAHPGEITVVALGPLTNVARAVQQDSKFTQNVAEIWVLAGSFFASGNVNPAAEANVMGDPEAADLVFSSGAKVMVVGLNVTTLSRLTEKDLDEIRASKGRFSETIHDITRCYLEWHRKSDHLNGIYLHDPSCLAGLLDPSLFTFKSGAVRVETEGLFRGLTILDQGLKNWSTNPWSDKPLCKVALAVDSERLVALVKQLLCKT